MKIGDKYIYGKDIKRTLEVKDEKQSWDFWRNGEPYDPEYGTLALVGNEENSDYFIWARNAVNSGNLQKL